MISCTEDQAKDIFRKWMADKPALLLMLFGPGISDSPQLTVSGRVFVKEIDAEFVAVSLGSETGLTISFSCCEFGYSDSREAPGIIRDVIESKYDSTLSMTLPCGLLAFFNELKQGTS